MQFRLQYSTEFWYYGIGQGVITVLSITPHP